MKSVIVISAGQLDTNGLVEVYADIGSTTLGSPKRIVVEGDWGWFAIGIDDEAAEEFSDIDRAKIAQLLHEPVYAQLEYSTSLAADMAVKLMTVTTDMLIDNDHGMLRPIEEVRGLILTGMEWQTTSA